MVTYLLESDQLGIRLGTAIAEELPGVAHFADLIEIEISDHQLVLVAARLREDLTTRITEVRLTVELADLPRFLEAHAIDGADEVAVGHGVRRLLELPQVLG